MRSPVFCSQNKQHKWFYFPFKKFFLLCSPTKKKTITQYRMKTVLHWTDERCVLFWTHLMPKDLHVCRLKVIPGSGLVLCPDFITSSFSGVSSGFQQSGGDVPPADLPKALICQGGMEITGRQISHVSQTVELFACVSKTKEQSRRAEQPFYLEMVRRLNPPSTPFEDAY